VTLTAVDIPAFTSAQPPESWRLLDDVEVLTLPDPEFLIQGLLPRNAVGVVYGPSGSGKTTIAAGLAVSLATGRNWFGHTVCHPGASIYVGAEDPGGFKVRLRAANLAARVPLDHAIGCFSFRDPVDLRDVTAVARFSAFLERAFEACDVARELLIVDTYAASVPGASENSSEDTTLAMSHAHRWRETLGLTVILIHHTNASGNRERGHSAMRGSADFMIALTPVDDVVHVECSKQRNAPNFDTFTLKLTPVPDGGCVFRLASDVLPTNTLTAVQAKVYAVLRDTFAAEGATKGEWQRTCADVAERSFHRAAKILQERGYVKAVGTHFRVTGGAR
jgi:KaiC/GvpD/RAD55 family RecA-like ATPase